MVDWMKNVILALFHSQEVALIQLAFSTFFRGAPELSSDRLVPAGSSIFEGSGSGRNR